MRASPASRKVRASRLASRLVGLGVGPDRLVALLAERSLELVVGLLAVGESYGKMLEDQAQIIADKATALGLVADEIQAVVDDINALIAAEGLYVLHVEAESIPALVQAVRDAEEPPPWSAEAYVAGVCLLGGTSGFGPVAELLGG